MSEGFRHFYYNNGFHEDNDQKSSNTTNFTLEQYSAYNTDTTPSTFSADHHNPHQMFEYPSHIISSSFNEIVFQVSNDHNSFTGVYGLTTVPSSSEVLLKEEQQLVSKAVQVTNEVPTTPNSSISSDSTEAATGDDHIQDSNKGKKESGADDDSVMKETLEGNEDPLKKEVKGKKKAEKKQKPPRFAFMTKSDVDHLEDGYRWRKYGQKAVKNSRYPRSYYRCTTQKCPVKKRIERSFQDPSIVITTYEGQHNHHVPANLGGNVATGIFPPPMFGHHQLPLALDQLNPGFHQEVMLSQMPHYFYGSYGGGVGTSNTRVYDLHQEQELQSLNVNPQQQQQQFQQFSDYGMLQDMMNPVFPKQEE